MKNLEITSYPHIRKFSKVNICSLFMENTSKRGFLNLSCLKERKFIRFIHKTKTVLLLNTKKYNHEVIIFMQAIFVQNLLNIEPKEAFRIYHA